MFGTGSPSILAELWTELGFDLKEHSGLTEEDFECMTEIDATGLKVEAPFSPP